MQKHPTSQLLEEYNRRQLAPDVFLVIHKHVTACPSCREHADASTPKPEDYKALLAALTLAPGDEPYHLSPAELAAYAKEQLNEIDRENAESHLEVCQDCADKMEAAHAKATSSMPVIAPSPANLLTSDSRPRRSPAPFFYSRAVQLAALAAIAGFVILLALFFFRTKTDDQIVRQPGSQNLNDQNVNDNQVPTPSLSQENQTPAPPSSNENVTSEAAVVLQLNDGGQQIVLNKDGEVKGVEQLPARVQQSIKTLLVTQRIERPSQLAELNGKQGTLLGSASDGLPFQLVSPLGKVLPGSRPTFRWRALEGAESYTVSITDTSLNVVASSAPLTALQWTPPAGLKAGVYSWQVTALKEGQRVTSPVMPAPQAKFRVLEADKLQELERARRAFSNSHLALGVMYTQAGLLDEAEREFQLLLRANPQSALARKLLAQVRAMPHGR